MELLVPILIGLSLLGSAVTAIPTLIMEWARHDSPEVVFYVDTPHPVVALTIDDGPSTATAEILEVLAAHDARATFFVIGDHVRKEPELARRMLAEGHELGHHMMFDQRSIDLPPDTFRARFDEMDAMLDELGGSTVFRPASGWYDDRMIAEAASRGYTTVLGSVYPFDAQIPFASVSTWYMRQLVVPGSVLVLHDGPERGQRTAEVLRALLPELRARGFRVVPVTELMVLEGLTPVADRTGYE